MISKGDPSALRALNRRNILYHLRRLGPTSRTKLVELTGLSPASITGVTAELIEDRLLTETSVGEAGLTGGRRPIYLDIAYDAHYAIGLKLREDRVDAVITDLATRVHGHLSESLASKTPADVAAQIRAICKKLCRSAKTTATDVIGIGIGLSGVIDAQHGKAVHAPLLGWHDVHIGDLVSEQTGLPTWIDNDVNGFAAAQRLFGHGKQASNFITVAVGRGLGAAFVVNGEVYRGRNGGAGEFGHNVIVPGGRLCSCGRHGCLEAYTASPALLEQYAQLQPERTGLTIEDLTALASSGDPDAQSVFRAAGELLGLHLSYLINALNPELIVVGGEGAAFGAAYFQPMQDTLTAFAFDGLAADLPLEIVPWNREDFTPWAQGAASLAIQHAFDTGGVIKAAAVNTRA
ncbi:ROK family protein [Deinococcus ruber]|uniref:Sugar kinase n=1 Tax=Deinococcus ruber TaxID=1848197 RepID=A0A918CL48_9DEIO|nr:ROK family protein [Deinococcus ruber]GGR28939.1 sugar kinase [Deinococcus ruber]